MLVDETAQRSCCALRDGSARLLLAVLAVVEEMRVVRMMAVILAVVAVSIEEVRPNRVRPNRR